MSSTQTGPNALTILSDKNSDPKKRVSAFCTIIDVKKPEITKLLPSSTNYETFKTIAVCAIKENPKLLDCDPESLFRGFNYIAQLDLKAFSPVNRECWLIPTWNSKNKRYDARFQIGYQGLKKLASKNPFIAFVDARCVFEKDFFELEHTDSGTKFVHKPALTDQGSLIGAYCVIRSKDGYSLVEFINIDEIEKARSQSASGADGKKDNQGNPIKPSGPWVTHYNEMARKTAIIRTLNKANNAFGESLDKTTQNAIALDNQGIADEPKKLTADTDTGLFYAEPDEQPRIIDSLHDVDTSTSPLNQPIAQPQATQPTLLEVEVVN